MALSLLTRELPIHCRQLSVERPSMTQAVREVDNLATRCVRTYLSVELLGAQIKGAEERCFPKPLMSVLSSWGLRGGLRVQPLARSHLPRIALLRGRRESDRKCTAKVCREPNPLPDSD